MANSVLIILFIFIFLIIIGVIIFLLTRKKDSLNSNYNPSNYNNSNNSSNDNSSNNNSSGLVNSILDSANKPPTTIKPYERKEQKLGPYGGRIATGLEIAFTVCK